MRMTSVGFRPFERRGLVVAGLLAAAVLATAPWARPAGADARTATASTPRPASLRTAMQRQLYAIRPSANAAGEGGPRYQAQNPGHGLRAQFTPGEFRVSGEAPSGRGWSWGMRLASAGYGSAQRPVPPATLVARGNRIEYRRGSLVEWYLNDPRGIEQGFTLETPPGERAGGAPLALELALLGNLEPRVTHEGRGLIFARPGSDPLLRYGELVARDARGRELLVRMALVPAKTASRPRLRLTVADAEAVYPVTIDPLVTSWLFPPELPFLLAGKEDDRFGTAVATSRDGNAVVVGAPGTEYDGRPAHGFAYVFHWDAVYSAWREAMLRPDDGDAWGHFGSAVALSGDVAVVGAPGQSDQRGAAYVFRRDGTGWWNWQLETKLVATSPQLLDRFGLSVAVSGDVAVVGAPGDDEERGSAYVFRWDGVSEWQREQKISAPPGTGFHFGEFVAISGEVIVVSSRRDDLGSGLYQGSAYVFRWDGIGEWAQEQRLSATGGEAGDSFGSSVAASGDIVVVGAEGDDEGRGSAYVFRWDGVSWGQELLLASDRGVGDLFGDSVAVSGEGVVVGAPGAYEGRGSATVFTWSGGVRIGGVRSEERLAAGDVRVKFGRSVAVSANRVFVGGPEYELWGAQNAGLVLAYRLTIEARLAEQHLGATTVRDWFGSAVAISDRAAVVGVSGDDHLSGLIDDGSARAYRWDVGGAQSTGNWHWSPWTPGRWGEDLPRATAESGDHFGRAVAVSDSEEWIAVGAPSVASGSSNPGSVELLRWNGSWWERHQEIVATQGTAGDLFGFAVAISGSILAVGAPNDTVGANEGQGSVYVFRLEGGSWTFEQKISASDGRAEDSFGLSVALSGDSAGTLVVGAPGVNTNRGAAYVFGPSLDGPWYQRDKLAPLDAVPDADFGWSVAVDATGGFIFVGAPGDDDDQGSVRAFESTHGGFVEARTHVAPDPGYGYRFGSSVAVGGARWIAGAPGADGRRGAAYVFNRFSQVTHKLTAWDREPWDRFGSSVGISQGWAIVGAPEADWYGVDEAGKAYIYSLPEAVCIDGRDNDGDGMVDLQDPQCEEEWTIWEEARDPVVDWGPPPQACADGGDADGDGLIDLHDPDCSSPIDPLEAPDADGDAVADGSDNCIQVSNPDQKDADLDGYGNACDGDFNEDLFIGGPDFDLFLQCFNRGTGPGVRPADDPDCEESDMNADGFVGGPDFDLFLRVFNGPPGPSGVVESAAAPAATTASVSTRTACGLGFELAPLLAGLWCLRKRRWRSHRAPCSRSLM